MFVNEERFTEVAFGRIAAYFRVGRYQVTPLGCLGRISAATARHDCLDRYG